MTTSLPIRCLVITAARLQAQTKPGAGLIEQAAGGTLFLDEIGDLSQASQVKLLRLLQEGEYYPLGSDRPKRLRARVVVATHQDLAQKQKNGEFRKDLFYRLKTHRVDIPPLRQRNSDIPLLLEHFLQEAANELGKNKPTIPKELPVLLANYAFPGNVRELRALAFDAMSLHRSRMLSMDVFRQVLDQDIAAPEPETHTDQMLFNPERPLPTLQEVGGSIGQRSNAPGSGKPVAGFQTAWDLTTRLEQAN